jgi:hypothetical protein
LAKGFVADYATVLGHVVEIEQKKAERSQGNIPGPLRLGQTWTLHRAVSVK